MKRNDKSPEDRKRWLTNKKIGRPKQQWNAETKQWEKKIAISEQQIALFVEEAEKGYDPDSLKDKPRGLGKPPLPRRVND